MKRRTLKKDDYIQNHKESINNYKQKLYRLCSLTSVNKNSLTKVYIIKITTRPKIQTFHIIRRNTCRHTNTDT